MELVRTYLREPQRLIESNLISNNDLTLLYYDTMAGEVDNPRIEREMERVSRERLREQERLIREIRGEQEAAEGADRSPESAAAAGEEAVGRDTLIYRDSRERSTETTDLVRESQTLIERQQEYNRIIRDVVSQAYEAEEERRYAAGGIGEGPGTDEGDLPLIYREEEEVPESEESIASRTEEILERRRVYNEIVERVKREQEAGEAVPGEEVISPEEAAHRTEFALTYRDVSDRTEAVEQIETQTQEIIERQNNVNQVIEEIRNQPTESVREAPTAREHVWFVHRSTQNTIDEETIEELRESLRHQESQTTQTTESFHNVENVEHRTVEGTTRQVISREDQNEEITEIVNRSLRGRLDEISNRVYGRIEKQLNSERRRRGL